MDVYLETGGSRVFACAVDWPGWCRSGKTDAAALAALVEYGPRYAASIGSDWGFATPAAKDLVIVEQLRGGRGTDFGVPSVEAVADQRKVDASELDRLSGLLRAAWVALDHAAELAAGHELRKGPRGGGRDLDKMVLHVLEAEEAYLRAIGGSPREAPAMAHGIDARMTGVRAMALDALVDRVRAVEPPLNPRRSRPYWSIRYFVRRSAWHALDHAWEIEDRVH